MFLSKYLSGDFLSTHTDYVEKRDIAFVYQLTKYWRPEYGGLFYLRDYVIKLLKMSKLLTKII